VGDPPALLHHLLGALAVQDEERHAAEVACHGSLRGGSVHPRRRSPRDRFLRTRWRGPRSSETPHNYALFENTSGGARGEGRGSEAIHVGVSAVAGGTCSGKIGVCTFTEKVNQSAGASNGASPHYLVVSRATQRALK
jgi:hypothetical protein